jgi:hypothetical protein
MRAAVNGAGQVAAGNSFPRGVAVPSIFGVLADTAVYITKKSGPCLQPQILRGYSCRGPEQHFLYYYTFSFSLIVEFAGGADMNKIIDGER